MGRRPRNRGKQDIQTSFEVKYESRPADGDWRDRQSLAATLALRAIPSEPLVRLDELVRAESGHQGDVARQHGRGQDLREEVGPAFSGAAEQLEAFLGRALAAPAADGADD